MPALNEERMKTIVLMEAYRTINVRDGEKVMGIPVIQAVIRSLALSAAKGHQRSQRLFTELLRLVEGEHKAHYEDYLEAAITYKTGWESELERRAKLGITAPDPIPHPDDIVINTRTGLVEIKGPMTKEEKAVWDKFRQRKKDCDEEIRYLTEMLEKDPDNRFLQDEIKHERRIRAIISKAIPD